MCCLCADGSHNHAFAASGSVGKYLCHNELPCGTSLPDAAKAWCCKRDHFARTTHPRVKDLDSHAIKALLVSRALLVKMKRDLENHPGHLAPH